MWGQVSYEEVYCLGNHRGRSLLVAGHHVLQEVNRVHSPLHSDIAQMTVTTITRLLEHQLIRPAHYRLLQYSKLKV